MEREPPCLKSEKVQSKEGCTHAILKAFISILIYFKERVTAQLQITPVSVKTKRTPKNYCRCLLYFQNFAVQTESEEK